MANIPTALYLQGGPGLNCAIERVWFGENYPVLWWDQPRFFADAENAYQLTLDAAAEKLAELHATQRKPIHLIGWSFGARLALDRAHRAPEAIGTLTLLAPSLCLETAFARLRTYLAHKENADHPQPPPVSTGNHASFMQRVTAILTTPDLFSHYWAPSSRPQFDRHSSEAACTDWFNLPTFTAVSRELIQRPVLALPADHCAKIRILAGQHDPYFAPNTDIEFWKTLFPEVSIEIVDSSHMLPFETPPSEWLKA